MRLVLLLGFVVGAILGLPIAILVIFPVSLYRGARAVHASGTLYRATVSNHPTLSGPALVRLSGAFTPSTATAHDILGLAIRFQKEASDDPRAGDQDLLLGTFTSFATARASLASTDAADFLANAYSSVTPWTRTDGTVTTFTIPAAKQPDPAATGGDRLARLDADIAAGRAAWSLQSAGAPVATITLTGRSDGDPRLLRESMFRTGRGLRPLGIRNGLRAVIYPISQLARRLRGG
jgi:hypothetical protein